MLAGVHAFPYTPRIATGWIDLSALRDHVDRLLAAGVHAVVPCGSTGEFTYLDEVEHRRALEATVEVIAGRTSVIAMTTAFTTAEVIRYAKHAAEVGAAAQLVNLHSYFPLTDEQALTHLPLPPRPLPSCRWCPTTPPPSPASPPRSREDRGCTESTSLPI